MIQDHVTVSEGGGGLGKEYTADRRLRANSSYGILDLQPFIKNLKTSKNNIFETPRRVFNCGNLSAKTRKWRVNIVGRWH